MEINVIIDKIYFWNDEPGLSRWTSKEKSIYET